MKMMKKRRKRMVLEFVKVSTVYNSTSKSFLSL